MITAILIITGLVLINLILLVIIRWDQEYYWEDLRKSQHRVQDDITQIERRVKAIQWYLADDEDDLPGLDDKL